MVSSMNFWATGRPVASRGSEPLEGKVAVEAKHCLPPHQEECRPLKLQNTVVDHLHDAPECTDIVRHLE